MTALSPGRSAIAMESFLAAYCALIEAIRAAVEHAEKDDRAAEADQAERAEGASNKTGSALPGPQHLLSLLESKYEETRAAACSAKEDPAAIIRCALDACGLAKDLDFVRLDFADAPRRKQIDELVTRVVVAAYTVSLAAGQG